MLNGLNYEQHKGEQRYYHCQTPLYSVIVVGQGGLEPPTSLLLYGLPTLTADYFTIKLLAHRKLAGYRGETHQREQR